MTRARGPADLLRPGRMQASQHGNAFAAVLGNFQDRGHLPHLCMHAKTESAPFCAGRNPTKARRGQLRPHDHSILARVVSLHPLTPSKRAHDAGQIIVPCDQADASVEYVSVCAWVVS